MQIEKMAWKEIEDRLKDVDTVILPISPLEEHGYHLPVSVDYVRAYEVSRRAAEKAGVFCLPSLILGNLRKWYAYPGSVSIRKETLELVVIDICNSLKDTGFKRIIIISAHAGSGHVTAIRKALEKMDDADISFLKLSDLNREIREKLIETDNDCHAGEIETSDMLYLAPEEVRMEKAVKSFPEYPPDDSPRIEFKKANPSGVVGDATKAAKEKGEKLIEAAVENLVRIIDK